MNAHSQGYRELYVLPKQRTDRLWKAAAIAATAVVVVAGGSLMASAAHKAGAAKEAYLKSPVVMRCTDPLTGSDASVRAADIANIPGVIESARRNFVCGPILGAKTL